VNLRLTYVTALLGLAVVTQPASGDVPFLADKTLLVASRVTAKAYAFDLNQAQLLAGP
jgi:hypothetical protein